MRYATTLARHAARLVWLMAISVGANPAETWHQSTIKQVYALPDGAFVLMFDASSSACQNPNVDKYYYVVPSQNGVTDEGARKVYAAAMTAMAMDKVVAIAYDDSTPDCYINRLVVK